MILSEQELITICHIIHDRIIRISTHKYGLSDVDLEEVNKEIDGLYDLMYKVENIYGRV